MEQCEAVDTTKASVGGERLLDVLGAFAHVVSIGTLSDRAGADKGA